MIADKIPELAALSLEEKRQLFDESCADIASVDQDEPGPKLVRLLEQRWQAHEDDPSSAVTLKESRERLGAQ